MLSISFHFFLVFFFKNCLNNILYKQNQIYYKSRLALLMVLVLLQTHLQEQQRNNTLYLHIRLMMSHPNYVPEQSAGTPGTY